MPKWELIEGDNLAALRAMPSDSFDAIVTDPPASISFMGKEWDGDRGGRVQWIAWLCRIAKEMLRVLKPGGYAIVWALPRTSHWTATALEDAGFELREMAQHLFGSGFPKSHSISNDIDKLLGYPPRGRAIPTASTHLPDGKYATDKLTSNPVAPYEPRTPEGEKWSGFGTALKPAWEAWYVCRKPISESTVAANVLKHGTGALNVDASRIPISRGAAYSSRDDSTVYKDQSREDVQRNYSDGTVHPASFAHEHACSGILPASGALCALDSQQPQGFQDDCHLSCHLDDEHVREVEEDVQVCSRRQSDEDESPGRFSSTKYNPMSPSTCSQSTTGHVESQGRWPANLTISHAENCVLVGTTKVKGSRIDKPCPAPEINGHKWGTLQGNRGPRGISDEDGNEEIEVYACVPWCPVRMLDDQAGRKKSGMMKAGQRRKATLGGGGYNGDMPDEATSRGTYGDEGGVSRFFYTSKASRSEREAGLRGVVSCAKCGGLDSVEHRYASGKVEKCLRNDHATVKSIALMQWLCRLVTPAGGWILDPFAGSGSTGVAAMKEGFEFVGIEQDARSVLIARARIQHAFVSTVVESLATSASEKKGETK